MKTTLCFMLTLLTFITLSFVPNSFAQDDSPEYVVRLIYFLPNDRQPRPNIDADFDRVIKEVQKYFADVMEYHGFKRKTFRLETDENGKVIVHHLKGEFGTEYYQNAYQSVTEQQAIERKFGTSWLKHRNIYLVARDIQNEDLADNSFGGGAGRGYNTGGHANVPARAIYLGDPEIIIHELAHTFGLGHDNDFGEKNTYFPGGNTRVIRLASSDCAAKWFDRSRYFNTNQSIINENTSVQMLTPTLAAPPDVFRFRFEISDPDGLHQILFYGSGIGLLGCKDLNGKNITVEFATPDLLNSSVIRLNVMDRLGNFGEYRFPLDLISLLPSEVSEVISISDPNLATVAREVLKRAHSIDLSSEVEITQLDMLRLRSFLAFNRQITDLSSLQHAIRIHLLNLSQNQISDITPLTELTELRFLWIYDNQISDITPLTELTELRVLDISRNPILNFTPLTALTNLQELNLNHNQISDVPPLAELTNLHTLYLSYNQISDVAPLAELTNLHTLYLSHNQISDVAPLAELTNLHTLYLSHNQISDVAPLAELTNLHTLELSRNQISDVVPLAELTNLHTLYLSRNQISDVVPLSELTNLHTLFLPRNQISDVAPLAELTNLHTLYLSRNQISDVAPLVELMNLHTLELSRNQISDFTPFADMVNLKTLYLLWNPIKNRKPLLALLQKNPDVRIYLKDRNTPLPVTLSHFSAEHTNAGVILKWTTESEVDNAGFYIYRSETKDGEYKVINHDHDTRC